MPKGSESARRGSAGSQRSGGKRTSPRSSPQASGRAAAAPAGSKGKASSRAAGASPESGSAKAAGGVTQEALSWMQEAFSFLTAAASGGSSSSKVTTPPASHRTLTDPWVAAPDGVGMVRTSVLSQAKREHEAASGQAKVEDYVRETVRRSIQRAIMVSMLQRAVEDERVILS